MEVKAKKIVEEIGEISRGTKSVLELTETGIRPQELKKLHQSFKEGRLNVGALFTLLTEKAKAKDFSEAEFESLDLSQGRFDNLNLKGARFKHVVANSISFKKANIDGAQLEFDEGRVNINMNDASAKDAVFAGDFSGAQFVGSNFENASFEGCNLRSADFSRSNLKNANLTNIQTNDATKFSQLTSCHGFRIDRYALACLGDTQGGLTVGNKMDMDPVDDVALLRSQFSGFLAIAHYVALVAFIFPYVFFVITELVKLRMAREETGNSIRLLWALLRFIGRGPEEWKTGTLPIWYVFLPFVLYFLFNIFRSLLLWKTKKLETRQHVTEVPVRFSLANEKFWNQIYNFMFYFGWIGLLLALWNTIQFSMIKIPF